MMFYFYNMHCSRDLHRVPKNQFFRLLGIYFINIELIWPNFFSHTVLEFYVVLIGIKKN